MTIRVLGLPVRIVYLHILHFGELLEIEPDQVSNVEIVAIRCAHTREIHMSDAVIYIQFAIASKSIVDRDPAIGITFGRARTFEVFVERGFEQCICA